MSDTVIIAAVGQYSDGDTVRTIGVSTRRYHDPALSGTLEFGTFLPCLSGDGLRWEEQIRFQPQGGTTSVQVSDVTLINTEGTFDDWASYTVSGLTWTVKRGRPDQSWDEFETIFSAVGRGAPEFTGRTQMTIRLRDKFAAFSQPVSTTVFDVDVPNERYANRLVPVVYGEVYQVAALVIDPAFFRVYAAANLAVVRRVTEGGRPTTNWFDVENGYQVTQSVFGDTLPICADIGGPPIPDSELVDVLSDYGDLSTWAGSPAAPNGFVVYSEPADSSFTEDATNGGGLIVTTLVAGTDSDALTASTVAVQAANAYQDATGYDTGGSPSTDVADWSAYLNADDAAYVALEMLGQFIITQRLTLTNFGGAIATTKTITGIEIDVRAQAAGSGAADIEFFEVRLAFPNGSFSVNKAASTGITGTKTVYTFGADDDLWSTVLTPDLINSEGFGVRLAFRCDNGTVPVEARVFEVVMTVHHNDGSKTVRIYADTATDSDLELGTGDRYRVRITHDDLGASPEDEVSVRWAAVDAIGDPIPRLTRVPGSTGALTGSENFDDPNVVTQGVMAGTGVLEGEFIADGPVFGIEFYPEPGQSGEQRIIRIELEQISIAVNTFKDLIRKLAEEAGFDPDTDVDNDALDAIETATGTPKMGWMVRNQTGRDQLATTFAHSCASTVWGGMDGILHAAMFCLPGANDWDSTNFLSLDASRNMGDSVSVADEADDLRDRVHAAQNVDPLRENETAGITETWPETERQKVLADWRITERADFEAIEGGTVWPITDEDVQTSTVIIALETGSGNWTTPAGVSILTNALLVGGGAGGGTGGGTSSGGAGAGGGRVVLLENYPVTPGADLAYVVGDGGASDTDGDDTSFDGQTAPGGGNGAGFIGGTEDSGDGGSSGGTCASSGGSEGSVGATEPGSPEAGFGNVGGTSNGNNSTSGGGGGAGGPGQDAPDSSTCGDGGAPYDASSIFGTTYGAAGKFGAGGGGGAGSGKTAGSGGDGGGDGGSGGSFDSSQNAQDGTGAGGGGGTFNNSDGGAGGKGIILLKFDAPAATITAISPAVGDEDGGESVTITGENFIEGAVSVSIGGSDATSVTVVDSETITCDTPAGSGTGDVVVTMGDKSATLADGFTFADFDILGSFSPVNWYDVSQESFTDAQSVETWTDQGSDGVDLTQATEAKRPTYDEDNDWLVFNEPDDQIMQTSGATAVSQPNTVVFVGEITTAIEDQVYFDGENGTASQRQSFDAFNNDISIWGGGFVGTSTGTGGIAQPMAVYILTYDGSSGELRQNDTVLASGNSGSQTGKGFTLAGRNNDAAGRHSGIRIHELAKISGTMTEQEKADVVTALKAKWGID